MYWLAPPGGTPGWLRQATRAGKLTLTPGSDPSLPLLPGGGGFWVTAGGGISGDRQGFKWHRALYAFSDALAGFPRLVLSNYPYCVRLLQPQLSELKRSPRCLREPHDTVSPSRGIQGQGLWAVLRQPGGRPCINWPNRREATGRNCLSLRPSTCPLPAGVFWSSVPLLRVNAAVNRSAASW